MATVALQKIMLRRLLGSARVSGGTGACATYYRLSTTLIDELGFVPLSKTGTELLFELVSQRYERAAVLITSNLPSTNGPRRSARSA